MSAGVDPRINASIERFMDDALSGRRKIPHNSVVLHLTQERIAQLMTPKRLELIRLIRAKKPRFMKELAGLAKWKLQAVARDLRIYQRYDIVELHREGKAMRPAVKKAMIIVPLGLPEPRRRESPAGSPLQGSAPASIAVSAQNAK
jgi:predicted transcriptional regulator